MEEEQKGEFHTVRGYRLMEQSRKLLSPSLEDYLEMIYRRIKEDGRVRVNALAGWLNVQPSSVSKMLQKLSEFQFVVYRKYGIIELTDEGEGLGKYLLWRHNTVHRFLSTLHGHSGEDLLEEAELVEHNLSRETVERLADLNRFLDGNEYSEFLLNIKEERS